ncbi:MAG: hypothetical protein ACRDR6_05015 [Pseudonocardiaceae bacterium]
MSEVNAARVWLVAPRGTAPAPTDHPTVRDDLMRTWRPSPDGRYTSGAGRHHATWDELRAQHDLVEVTEGRMAQAILWGTP